MTTRCPIVVMPSWACGPPAHEVTLDSSRVAVRRPFMRRRHPLPRSVPRSIRRQPHHAGGHAGTPSFCSGISLVDASRAPRPAGDHQLLMRRSRGPRDRAVTIANGRCRATASVSNIEAGLPTRPARAKTGLAARSNRADFEAKGSRPPRSILGQKRPVNTGPTSLTEPGLSDAVRLPSPGHRGLHVHATLERSSRFRERRASGREHQPRTLQLAFRVAF